MSKDDGSRIIHLGTPELATERGGPIGRDNEGPSVNNGAVSPKEAR